MSREALNPLCDEKYNGEEVGLVIGIDIGTTFSGVSYAILRPGEVPVVYPVTRFSGQEATLSKIPSVIYYDSDLNIKAIGAETTSLNVARDAEEQGWFKCEHFKLHLRPDKFVVAPRKPGQRPLQTYAEPDVADARKYPQPKKFDTKGLKVGQLPPGKTAESVTADFLKHLLEQTEKNIKANHADGTKIWKEAEDKTVFVIGHPNSWAGKPQERYRKAAVEAGLTPDDSDGKERIRFVTEGEASALSCLAGGLGPSKLDENFQFIVVDAGGGTIDTSSYRVRQESPVELEECATGDSTFAGSVVVNKYALELLRRVLKDSEFDHENALREIVDNSFEMKTKRQFAGDEEFVLVSIGDRRLNNPQRGIKGGFLQLKTEDVSECFSLSVRETVASVKRHLAALERNDSVQVPVWLVGGFADSPYLLKKLNEELAEMNVTVQRPHNNTAKAVPDGTVRYYVDKAVKSRRATTSYGMMCNIPFMPSNPEHEDRSHLVTQDDGIYWIGPAFDCIVAKGSPVETSETFESAYDEDFWSIEDAKDFQKEIYVYDGKLPYPIWWMENEDKFRLLCTLHADLSDLCQHSTNNHSSFTSYAQEEPWTCRFSIVMKLGTTELEVAVKYNVNGEDRCGPVEIIYDQKLDSCPSFPPHI